MSRCFGNSNLNTKKEAKRTLNALEQSLPRGITLKSNIRLKDNGCSRDPTTIRKGCLWWTTSFALAIAEIDAFSCWCNIIISSDYVGIKTSLLFVTFTKWNRRSSLDSKDAFLTLYTAGISCKHKMREFMESKTSKKKSFQCY